MFSGNFPSNSSAIKSSFFKSLWLEEGTKNYSGDRNVLILFGMVATPGVYKTVKIVQTETLRSVHITIYNYTSIKTITF